MRADRLLSLMMLLQTNRLMTAADLAHELSVSKRTIYRDIDTLSAARVPVYAVGGPGGGYGLLDSYRATLTGLNKEEARALFMLTIPGPISDLGVSHQLKTAILKMTNVLAADYREQAGYLRQRLYLDAAGWFQKSDPVPHLKTIQEAVWQDRQLILTYRRRSGLAGARTVSPYGLVAKASIWYLVAATDRGMRVYRASRIEAADLAESTFTRPDDFDLPGFWSDWVAEYEASMPEYPVTLNVGPDLAPVLHHILGEEVRELVAQAEPDANGWRVIDLTFERAEEAHTYVMGMGAAVDIISPEELRFRVLASARDIVAHYED